MKVSIGAAPQRSARYSMSRGLVSVLQTARRRLAALALISAVFVAGPSFAANYPLELVSPRAEGTAPATGNAAITAGNRIFKAYPGIEYNIRAVVIGGTYPYSFALSNAPTGMTINPDTGEIRWLNPSGSSATPTISVTDAEGTQRSSPWTIAVTTSGFKFVDAINGSASGNGTISSPWRTISDVANASSAVRGDIVYFRNGVYNTNGMPRSSVGSVWERVEIAENRPNAWIAYPGERPTLDFGFVPNSATGALVRLDHTNLYIDGFETRNSRIIGFQTGAGSYGVFRRLRMHDHNMVRANLDGTNASFIMTLTSNGGEAGGTPASWGQYLAIQDNEFYNAPVDMALKIYSQWKMLIENNVFRDLNFGAELKADIPQFSYRANRHLGLPGRSIGGNMHSYSTHGEIMFNLVYSPSGEFALDVNQDGYAKRIDIYRNTFVGRVRVRNTDSSDGVFRFYNNVIVSPDSGTKIYLENVSDSSRIVSNENLTGNPGTTVDASGALTGQFAQYVGSRGYQVGVSPYPPTQLSVQ